MQINFHIEDQTVLENDKQLMEEKLGKLKRFVRSEPLVIDLYMTDEADKTNDGGVDHSVRIAAQFGKEQIFIEKVDSEAMRAFAHCYKKMEIALEKYHEKLVDWKTGSEE